MTEKEWEKVGKKKREEFGLESSWKVNRERKELKIPYKKGDVGPSYKTKAQVKAIKAKMGEKRQSFKESDKTSGSSPSQRKKNRGYHDPYEMASEAPNRNWKV